MKKILLVLLALLCAVSARAQLSYATVRRGDIQYCGLKNTAGQWVVSPEYRACNRLAHGYWALQNFDFKWGVVAQNGKLTVPFIYDDISGTAAGGTGIFPWMPFKKDGYYGLITYDIHLVILPFQYSEVVVWGNSNPSSFVTTRVWNSSKGSYDWEKYRETELRQKRAELLVQIRQREREEITRRMEEVARRKKEEKLASFTSYAKNYVEPKVNSWQQKGEFETTAEFQTRVTGASRSSYITTLTAEAERKFIEEHAELNKNMPLTLGLYDADNQTFKLTSARFGDFFLPVPRAEAPDFKQRFSQFAPADVRYYIADDKIAVGGFLLRDASGKSYRCDNSRSVVYNTYEIAYEKFDFQPIVTASSSRGVRADEKRVVLQQPAAVKPVLTILSPSDGGSYTQREVTVRYSVRSGDGGPAEIRVYIDGELYEPPTGKGVKAASNEVTLPLPQQPGKSCTVLLEAANSSGLMAQRKINLLYKGEQLKPRLHILSVGVGDYADAGISKLHQSPKDARDFAAAVTGCGNAQYSRVGTPVLLTDRAATAAGIKSALAKLATDVRQNDVVMLFFSGHGAEERGKIYFLSSDAQPDNYFTTAVKFDDIRDVMEYLVSKKCRVVIFMDTCYSGAMFGAKGAEDVFTLASPDIVGFYSSTRSEKSNESEKWNNGIFTRALIEGIKGAAADGNRRVTIQSLDTYIKRVVDRETGGRQSPILENKVGDFILF